MAAPITSMKDAYSLKGKIAIVTGASRGIGFGIATAMAQSGADVAIFCRGIEKGYEAAAKIREYGVRCEAFQCDVSDLQSVKAAVAACYEKFDPVDILVNNAGVATTTAFMDMDENLDEWYRVLNTDLNGMVHMSFEVGKRMKEAGRGGCSIINVTSNAGMIVNDGISIIAYSVAKAGANHFTHCLASELSDYDITVNGIAPGFTHSTFSEAMPQEMEDALNAGTLTHRFGEPIEVGALAVYLASPASRQVTGMVVVIDGGYMIRV